MAAPLLDPLPTFDAEAEFDRQVTNLVDLGYPAAARTSRHGFLHVVEPLREQVLRHATQMIAPTDDRVPLVVVVTQRVVPADRSMPLTSLPLTRPKPGFVSADTADIARFVPIDTVDVPPSDAYLLLDVDRGADYLDVRPDDALAAITARDCSPLTVDEGIAFVTAFPGSLAKNRCFSLVASRCGDRRVPALWISKGAPKLGWCWAGNPHTWLGSAFCRGRVAAE